MRNKLSSLPFTALLLGFTASLSACAAPSSTLVISHGVTAAGHLQVNDSNGRKLLAAVTPWTSAAIHHLNLNLKDGATSVATLTVAQADLSKTVSFANLKKNTAYTIVATAYADAAETQAIDNGSANAASCTTTFATTQDDLVNIGTINVKLRDKTFAGQADPASITVTPGAVVDTAAAETITLN